MAADSVPIAQGKAADSVPKPHAIASFLGRIGRQLSEATEPVSPSNAVSAMVDIPNPGRSGVLHYEGPAMKFGGHVVFSNLPQERLGFTYDHSLWNLELGRNPNGTQFVVVTPLRRRGQTHCDVGWEIVE
jgi:hypothetical protein